MVVAMTVVVTPSIFRLPNCHQSVPTTWSSISRRFWTPVFLSLKLSCVVRSGMVPPSVVLCNALTLPMAGGARFLSVGFETGFWKSVPIVQTLTEPQKEPLSFLPRSLLESSLFLASVRVVREFWNPLTVSTLSSLPCVWRGSLVSSFSWLLFLGCCFQAASGGEDEEILAEKRAMRDEIQRQREDALRARQEIEMASGFQPTGFTTEMGGHQLARREI